MNFDLKARTHLLVVAGSRCYGIHTDASDVDVKGVCVPSLPYFLGYLQNFDQADKASHMEPFIELMNGEEKAAIERDKIEGSIYNLVKFVKLAAGCNPNILDVIFCRDEEVRLATPIGRKLRAAAPQFISAKAKHTFSGYAAAQLKRIKGHKRWLLDPPTHKPTRGEYGLPEFTLIPKDQLAAVQAAVSKQIDRWEVDFGTLADSEIVHIQGHVANFLATFTKALEAPPTKLAAVLRKAEADLSSIVAEERAFLDLSSEFGHHPGRRSLREGTQGVLEDIKAALAAPDVADAKWLAAARVVGVDDNLILVMQREREYQAAARHYKQYQNWKKKRNPARAKLEAAHGFDTKHGCHLVRLLRMGREILETGKVHVWRGAGVSDGPNDREELLAIRRGAWKYDDLVEWAETEDKALQTMYKQREYVVPGQPDRPALDKLTVDLVSEALGLSGFDPGGLVIAGNIGTVNM